MKMSILRRITTPLHIRNTTSISLSLLHTSTLSPPPQQQHPPSPPPPTAVPTTAYYDTLVNSAGRSGDLDRVRGLLIKRIDDGCFNSRDTFSFLTNTQSSLSSLPNLIHCLSSLPKGVPRRSAFESLLHRLSKLNLIADSLRLLRRMRRRNFELNAASFHPVLNALSRKNHARDALRVVELMKEMGVDRDATSYNYVLTAFCMKGEVVDAAEVVEKMEEGEKWMKLDLRTYDALVIGACKVGKIEGAVGLIRVAVEDGIRLMYCTYAHVIKGLLEGGYYAQAVKFVMIFAGREKGLDKENFELLGCGFVKLKRVEDAKMVVDEMNKRGLVVSHKLRDFYDLHS